MKPLTATKNGKSVEQIKAYLAAMPSLTGDYGDIDQVPKMTGLNNSEINKEILVCNVSLDSRQIKQGDLFIALQGEKAHGLDYLEAVLAKQPSIIITDKALNIAQSQLVEKYQNTHELNIWVIAEIASQLGNFASWFYNQPSKSLKVIGVTGTNGKTSTAFFTGQLLKAQGAKVALMGTLGNGDIDNLQATQNTTPDALQVQRLLHDFATQGFEWVVMEVSSHALCLGRVQAVEFNSVALTQVTRDHIDFHGTETAYKEAKTRLFKEYKTGHAIVNAADETGQKIIADLVKNQTGNTVLFSYDAQNELAELEQTQFNNEQKVKGSKPIDLNMKNLSLNAKGIQATLCFKGEEQSLSTPLMGAFNTENLMCAVSILLANGMALNSLLDSVAKLQSVAGRMQVVHQSPTVIVDFAHTPDALLQVLRAIKAHTLAKKDSQTQSAKDLWVVFGCGGDRDKGKRPIMAQIAQAEASKVMLTSDNPRSEDPKQIIAEVKAGFEQLDNVLIEQDRATAIDKVLSQAKPNDMVLIAGKGHENYQEINGVKHEYSDIEQVAKFYAGA